MDLSTLSAMPTIKRVMTPFPYYVELDDPILRAVDMMKIHEVHHIPVQEHGRLVGILTQSEVDRCSAASATPNTSSELRVRDVHIGDAFVIDLTHPMDEVLDEMIQNHLDSALVTRKGKLVGIFSTTDACRILQELLHAKFPGAGGEAA